MGIHYQMPCLHWGFKEYLAASVQWGPRSLLGHPRGSHTACHTDLQLTSEGAQPPLVSRAPWQNIPLSDQSSDLGSSFFCFPGPLPSPSAYSF